MIDNFLNPEAFLLIIFPAVYAIIRWFAGKGYKFTSMQIIRKIKPSLKQRLAIVPKIIFYLVILIIITALARPQKILEQSFSSTEGVAMEIVIDRSSSMKDEMMYNDEWKSKLDIVKNLFIEFVQGGDSLPGRPMDLIGLIHFARFPETAMPLSLQHTILTDYLPYIKTADPMGNEDGTAIGDAIMLAASRLKQYEDYTNNDKSYSIKSKIIILLTDGENTAGTIKPSEAAEQAGKWGIKIYSVAINSEELSRTYTDFNQTIRTMLPIRMIDEKFLREISDLSSGRYWIARNSGELKEIYAEIDKMEKSKISTSEYREAKELFPVFILAAIIGLLIFIILRSLIFRRMES